MRRRSFESCHGGSRPSFSMRCCKRRMAEAFFEGTLAAPFAFSDTVLPTGTVVSQSQESFWKALLRYIVSSTVGCAKLQFELTLPNSTPVQTTRRGMHRCYLTAPAVEASDTIGSTADGEPLRILRPSSEKLCFPARTPFSKLKPFQSNCSSTSLCSVCSSVCSAQHPILPRAHQHRRGGLVRPCQRPF